jgi:lysophospholipase L1-like esterase
MKIKNSIFLVIVFLVVISCTPKKLNWVAIGDSITYLNEHTDETGNRVTKGYMTRVSEKLPNVTYINQGHNGWTSGGIAENIEKLDLVPADVYSVFLGTNDWWQGRPIGTLSDYQNNTGNNTVNGSFRIIIDKLRILNKDARIILITPMQRVDFVYIANFENNAWGSYRDKNGQWLADFANAILAVGKFENFDVLDLYNVPELRIENLVKFKRLRDPETGNYKDYSYPQFIDIPFNPKTDEYPYPVDAIDMTYDGLHPSDKGNQIIAEMLVDILKEY